MFHILHHIIGDELPGDHRKLSIRLIRRPPPTVSPRISVTSSMLETLRNNLKQLDVELELLQLHESLKFY